MCEKPDTSKQMNGDKIGEEESAFGSHDARWGTTFPHLVRLFPDEWLPGVLLRCDAVNDWPSETTLRFVYQLARKGAAFSQLNFCAPTSFPYDELAAGLAMHVESIYNTTYIQEMQRLFFPAKPHPAQLGPFHRHHYRVCPLCIQQSKLCRFLALPGLTLCPQHHVVLHEQCVCLTPIRYFTSQSLLFCCHHCSHPWAGLPTIRGHEEKIHWEQQIFFLYQSLLNYGDTPLLERICVSVSQWMSQRHLVQLPLYDGSFLGYDAAFHSNSFSLCRLILAIVSIRQADPDYDQTFGLKDALSF